MNMQEHIEEGRSMVERLLASPQIPFKDPKTADMGDIPDKPGIYLFSSQTTEEPLYVGVGRSERGGIERRMKDHWSGSSSFIKRIKRLQDIANSKEWLEDNVSISWLTEDKLGMCLMHAEHFAIGALRPEHNQ